MVAVVSLRHDSVQVALNSYDILLHLFDHLQSSHKGSNRAALAACARVCRAWQDPASYVLWRNLPALHPLWNLLAGRNFSPEAKWISPFWQFIDPDDFVKDVVAKDRERWNHFLHRASHVREVGIAACGEKELALIRSLTEHNKSKSLLPSLQRLSWRHSVPADTSVLLLSSSVLRDLEVAVSRLGTESGMTINSIVPFGPSKVDPMFVRLAEGVPHLHRLTLSGRQGPGPAIVPHLLHLTRLRELLLYNQSITLNPEQMNSIFEHMADLEALHAHIVDFTDTDLTAHAPSLRSLSLRGDSPPLHGLLSGYLDAPSLRSLTLQTSDENYSQKSHQLFAILAHANFTQSLRALSITLLNDPTEVVWNDPTVGSYSTIIEPLFALKDLSSIDICLANCLTPFADADVAAIARAWPRVQKLHIGWAPYRAHTRPPLTSLRHFAEHCPALEQLCMTKLGIPDALDLPAAPRATAHPLRLLDLKMTFARNYDGGRLEKAIIAQYLDHLFPNLVLNDREAGGGLGGMLTWQAVEQEIRMLRQSQRPSK
ncbi:hypothetical protein GSI_03130 [Ganoderma sinense ZZ0214-1]|uniref:F-box domain-containing protein n=1 Tax=Ganoderma sinense ZZ0214-1 TaxID=1077348 RepID=A0A2G8SKR2_9APHY|nr:hypothetical protein GSI_03130 [Ganoderma sinense ZZ0214-1]